MPFIQSYGINPISHKGSVPESSPEASHGMQGMRINSAVFEKRNASPVLTVEFQKQMR